VKTRIDLTGHEKLTVCNETALEILLEIEEDTPSCKKTGSAPIKARRIGRGIIMFTYIYSI
jgi:hypothetical protein